MKRLRKKKPKYLAGPMKPDELIKLIKEKLPDSIHVSLGTSLDAEREFSHICRDGLYEVVILGIIYKNSFHMYDVFPKNLRVVYASNLEVYWNEYGAKELTKKLRKI